MTRIIGSLLHCLCPEHGILTTRSAGSWVGLPPQGSTETHAPRPRHHASSSYAVEVLYKKTT